MMHRQREAKYELLNSLEEMLSPETVSDLLQRRVHRVTYQPFESAGGLSGSLLYRVQADDLPLVMKRHRPSLDWICIATGDTRCRAVRMWQYGLLDRLRPHLEHAQLAACQYGDDYAILMHDISRGLFRYERPIPETTLYRLLDSLAALHAMFWEDDSLTDPELGLCGVESLVQGFWPVHVDRFRHDRKAVEYMTKGWAALFELVEPDVRALLHSLMENPQPLLAALAKFPSTLVHGDYRTGNLALLPDTDQIVSFDWQVAGYVPATLCMCWFVMTGEFLRIQDEAAAYYRTQLAKRLGDRFDPAWWQPMYDIGCLVDVLRKGCWHAYFATYNDDEVFRADMRRSVDSYNAIVRTGVTWL